MQEKESDGNVMEWKASKRKKLDGWSYESHESFSMVGWSFPHVGLPLRYNQWKATTKLHYAQDHQGHVTLVFGDRNEALGATIYKTNGYTLHAYA